MNQIGEFFTRLLDDSDWPPRWHCGRWTDFHGWLYIVSDILIWSAYFTIPLVIIKYISKRQDVRFVKLYFLFAAFILACGSTHFIDAMAFWVPLYRLNALIRLITGILSWLTVFHLMKFLPVAFSLRSPQQLEAEIQQRQRAESVIKLMNAELEQRVRERTNELRKLNEELEDRVKLRTLQLEAANKELEAFTYSVSHDLRAPLRGIAGFTTMLEARLGPDPETRRINQIIVKNTLRMGRLIDDLLEFSRMARLGLTLIEVNTSSMVQEIIQELSPSGKHIRWDLGVLPAVEADIATIRQVWFNLLSNAVKYSSKSPSPHIRIGSYTEGDRIVYHVTDNGVGFDNKYRPKLFKVFQRLHSAEEFEGTGVGLAIVTKIITRHGGEVWADGVVGQGACFYFSLPINTSHQLSKHEGTAQDIDARRQ